MRSGESNSLGAAGSCQLEQLCCVVVLRGKADAHDDVSFADGGKAREFSITTKEAARLLGEASAAAASNGLAWTREPLKLFPSPKLADLIRKSRELAASGDVEEG